MSGGAGLRVLVDGTALSESDARAFWQRFSEWMEAHAGDLAGFARGEGLASVHPELHAGSPVLVGSRSATQQAYAAAAMKAAAAPAAASPKARKRKHRG